MSRLRMRQDHPIHKYKEFPMNPDDPKRGGKGGENEQEGDQSQWCEFFLSRDAAPSEPATVIIDTSADVPFRSKYYGRISDLEGPQAERSKVVFPWNRLVEEHVDVLAACGNSPWYLPCRLREGDNYIAAYAVDARKLLDLRQEELDPHQVLQVYTLQQRATGEQLVTMTQEVSDLRGEVDRLRRGQEFLLASQRSAFYAVDYQNFQKSARAGEWHTPLVQLSLTAAIESLRWFKADWPRRIDQVLVFDYESHCHEEFYHRIRANSFEFVAVPEMNDVAGKPIQVTDQFLCSEVLKRLRKPGHGIQDFILVSGDGDFVPLVRELRSRGLRVYAAGFSGHISSELERHTNGVMVLDQLIPLPPPEYWQHLAGPPSPGAGEKAEQPP